MNYYEYYYVISLKCMDSEFRPPLLCASNILPGIRIPHELNFGAELSSMSNINSRKLAVEPKSACICLTFCANQRFKCAVTLKLRVVIWNWVQKLSSGYLRKECIVILCCFLLSFVLLSFVAYLWSDISMESRITAGVYVNLTGFLPPRLLTIYSLNSAV